MALHGSAAAGLAAIALGTGCKQVAPPSASEVAVPASVVGAFGIVHVNDTYRIQGDTSSASGGMARLRTLRASLQADGTPVLLTHGGDLLGPSLLSRRYDGAQMVDVLNHLDGDGSAVDPHMLVTFGNHEFDAGDLDDVPGVQQAMDASQFTWLHTDIQFATDAAGQPLLASERLAPTWRGAIGGVEVGVFSLTIDSRTPAWIAGFSPKVETARAATQALRADGADVVIALTHLDVEADRALVSALGEDRPDLVLGGHNHVGMDVAVDGVHIVKGDAEARTAGVVRVELVQSAGDAEPVPHISTRLVALTDPDVPQDPAVQAVVDGWLTRHATEFCADRDQAPDCLDAQLTVAGTTLVAEETAIRRFETNLGDWVADLALDAFADQGAQVAFVNSGALRLNHDIAEGAPLTLRTVEELMPYPSQLKLVELDGRILAAVAARSAEEWAGNGNWLQISGFAFRHDPAQGEGAAAVSSLTLLTPDGPRPVDPDERILAVTIDYLVTPAYGQDGYTFLRPEAVIASGPALKTLITGALQSAGDDGIDPVRVGRICHAAHGGPCLAVP